MEGWIKIHRKILDNPIVCKDTETFTIWMYLLLNATHKEIDMLFEGKKITLKKGQLITGRKSISEKLSISESKVQRVLKMFEIEQQIEQQTTKHNRLISIINWEQYQEIEQQNEQQVNNNRTTTEQQLNTNKNVRMKECKNVRNVVVDESIKELINYYESNIGLLTPTTYERLISYLDDTRLELIEKAIEIASIKNQRSMAYVEGILRSWSSKGIKTIGDVENEQVKIKVKVDREETPEEWAERMEKEWAKNECG